MERLSQGIVGQGADLALVDDVDPLSLSFKSALIAAHDAFLRRDIELEASRLVVTDWADEVRAEPAASCHS